jgi:hypothetical protein
MVNDGKVNSTPDTVTITVASNIVRRYVNANDSIDDALFNLVQLGEGQSGEIIVSNGTYTRNSDAIIPLGWMLKGESKEGVIIYGGDHHWYSKGIIINFTFSNYGVMASGGAIFNDGGTVKDCTFSHAWDDAPGAGIYNKEGTVSNCIFESIEASCWGSPGGGVYNENGTVNNCTFTGCTASGEGGGIYNQNGTVNNCTFSNCSTGTGIAGGIFNDGGTVNDCTYVNCTPNATN